MHGRELCLDFKWNYQDATKTHVENYMRLAACGTCVHVPTYQVFYAVPFNLKRCVLNEKCLSSAALIDVCYVNCFQFGL